MTNDQFGTDLTSILRDFTRRLEKLEAAQRSGTGLQVGQASGAFLLPSSGVPSTPSSGVYLYASGSEYRWRDSTGADHAVPGQCDDVSNPPNFTSGTATGTDATVINALRVDAAGTKIAFDGLLSSLRADKVLR